MKLTFLKEQGARDKVKVGERGWIWSLGGVEILRAIK